MAIRSFDEILQEARKKLDEIERNKKGPNATKKTASMLGGSAVFPGHSAYVHGSNVPRKEQEV